MTIKQQGGIFGRNPTFNDVNVEGSLTVDGSALPSVDNIAVLDTAQTFTAKQTLSKAGATFDIFNFEYTGAGDRITMGLDGYNSIMKLFASNGAQSIQLSAGGANNSFFKGVDVEIHNANLVMATAGNGIDFSATSGTGTSELFDDYEEGQFSPYFYDDSNGQWAGSTASSGYYVKVGKVVHLTGTVTWSSKPASGGTLRVRALPYTAANPSNPSAPNTDFNNSLGDGIQIRIAATDFLFYDGGSLQGNGLIGTMASSGTFGFNVTYFV